MHIDLPLEDAGETDFGAKEPSDRVPKHGNERDASNVWIDRSIETPGSLLWLVARRIGRPPDDRASTDDINSVRA